MRSRLLVSLLAVVSVVATIVPAGAPAATSQEGLIPTELVAGPRFVTTISSAGVENKDWGLRARLTRADTGEPLAGQQIYWYTGGPERQIQCAIPFSCFGDEDYSITDANGVARRPSQPGDGSGGYGAAFLPWSEYEQASARGAARVIRIRVP